MLFTIIIILVTAGISIAAFQSEELFSKSMFNSYAIYHSKQYYRLLSHGFIHAGWAHLLFNMISFFFFAPIVIAEFGSPILFLLFYLSAIVVASLRSLILHKNDPNYNSVGASGGVSAVIFSFIMFHPLQEILLYGIPIKGFIFAFLYLAFSVYMSKQNRGNINHDAHFLGAIYGVLFTLVVEPSSAMNFIKQMGYYFQNIFS